MAVWKGAARLVTTTGGLLGADRRWSLSTANAQPTADQTNWDYTAGTTVTVYYHTWTTGATPPSAADNVQLEVRDSAGTVLDTLSTGTPPTDGDSFTFTLNNAGPVELYIQVDYDGIVGDYNLDSQGTETVGTNASFHRGLVRSNAQITDLAVSAYPAGSTFAYGTAADEVITLTATHTTPYTTTDGDIRLDALDVTAVQIQGVAKNYTSTTTTQTFTVNNGFDDTSKSYGVKAVPIGNPFIVPDSGAVGWTKFIDSGNGEQVGESVRRQSFYTVDPRITLGTPTLGESLYNRSESTTIDIGITNARGESLTRSMDYTLKDSQGATKATGSDTGTNYDINYTIGAADDALSNFTGAQWTLVMGQTDITTYPEVNVFLVSSKLMIGNAVGVDNQIITPGETVYNLGETTQIDYYMSFARGDAYVSAGGATSEVRAVDLTTEDSQGVSLVAGLVSYTYVIASGDQATYDLVGSAKSVRFVDSGNATSFHDASFGVSSKLMLGTAAGLNDLEMSLGQDVVRNRGETHPFEYYLSFARGDAYASITGLNQTIKDTGGATEDTQTGEATDANGKVASSYAIAAGDVAAYDLVGTAKNLELTDDLGNSCDTAVDVWRVSSKLLLGTAAGLNDLEMSLGQDVVRNLGETHPFEYYLSFARGDAYASITGLNQQVLAANDAVEDSVTNESTSAAGLVASSYVIAVGDAAAYDTVGALKKLALTDDTGNSTDTASDVWRVSSKLLMGSAAGLNDLAVTTDESIYNRGESPHIEYFLSFARGDAYANQTVTATVGAEDSQAIATTAGGKVDYTYLISATDAATNDFVGVGKPVASTHNGNSHDAVTDVFSVSSLYYFDVHSQLNGTLNKDDFPNEDDNEDYDFVILGDVVYVWMHVEGVRNDGTEIQTIGSSVQLLVKNPSGGVVQTYNLDSAADGWTSRIDQQPGAPAGDWVYEGSVAFEGNTANDSETITYITPLTSNLQVLSLPPVLAQPGTTHRFFLRTETDALGLEPQTLPIYRIYDSELSDSYIESGTMLNVVDDTATLNGYLYYIDITVPNDPGRYLFWAESQLNGNKIKTDAAFRVANNDFDPTGLFAGPA